ncbi:MAG: DEAD/DEAH box helicase [Acidobacteria bacterium]|nr:DEAD/DEAH box helicase [Acidobacteriota bacterium]
MTRLDLIQKYAGGEQVLMPLDRLGTPGWDKRRAKVGAAVKEMAGELLQLYAQRRAVRAPAYGPDSTWQREFESAFPHDLTADQSSALSDIKSDLSEPTPMDRLLCGDVGYGKTEVALRAAFKVVQEGGQVAVLVPTTVLAFQHLTTMRARMASWPVRVEMISRFVSAADTKKILDDAAKGEVDILIGTHRLLSKDVRFKKLGLLVVDEEQRFGVRHKEAIKKLSLGVHSLAMSATPIPRTLQLSLAGVRDLSVIETPPRNRLAIQTHLAPWSPSLVAAAIRNEMRRSGQVYYITPRVAGIEQVVTNLRELVPEASIVHAHGQMPEGQLERVMLQFVRGEADVLVATTIIENGLDISRANTILVSQAHRFGLSQLYQMRGRVGRSDQRAYAYLFIPPRRELTPEARQRLAALVEFSELGALFIPPRRELTPEARQRLAALVEFSELGAGFRIAAMDLEIRGAGEFLGARQSGHITAVGFEMYAELLEKAVRRLQGLPLPEAPEPVTINLGLPAFIPEEAIPHPGQRLEIYKRLSRADTIDEIRAIMEEAEDRFGRLGEPARNLFRQAELRVLAQEQGAVSIDWAGDAVAVRYGERPKVDGERVIQLLQRDDQVRMTAAGVLRLKVSDPRADRIAAASLALRKLAS